MKKILAIILVLLLAFAFTACGAPDDPVPTPTPAYLGLYTAYAIEGDIDGVNVCLSAEDFGMGEISFELKENGVCGLTSEEGDSLDASYKMDGDKITIFSEGGEDELKGTVKDGLMYIELDGTGNLILKTADADVSGIEIMTMDDIFGQA